MDLIFIAKQRNLLSRMPFANAAPEWVYGANRHSNQLKISVYNPDNISLLLCLTLRPSHRFDPVVGQNNLVRWAGQLPKARWETR